MSIFVRLAGDIPTFQKAFFRNLIAVGVAFVILARTPEGFHVKKTSWKNLFFRSFFGSMGIICNFCAIDHIGIADANMLNKMSPFFAILMSIFLLREKPKRIDIFSVIIALIGAAFVIKPSASIASFGACIALFGGFTSGTAYTFVRKLGQSGERGPVIVLFFSAFSTILCVPFILTGHAPMSLGQWFCLLLAGTCASIAQLNITAAYTYAPAAKISVFDYVQVLFAALWGFLFFSEIPDRYSVIGYVLIIGIAVFKYIINNKKRLAH